MHSFCGLPGRGTSPKCGRNAFGLSTRHLRRWYDSEVPNSEAPQNSPPAVTASAVGGKATRSVVAESLRRRAARRGARAIVRPRPLRRKENRQTHQQTCSEQNRAPRQSQTEQIILLNPHEVPRTPPAARPPASRRPVCTTPACTTPAACATRTRHVCLHRLSASRLR
eukprot:scaffold56727_cov40-Phaeocystis_antarctica.AAC.1